MNDERVDCIMHIVHYVALYTITLHYELRCEDIL